VQQKTRISQNNSRHFDWFLCAELPPNVVQEMMQLSDNERYNCNIDTGLLIGVSISWQASTATK
jgi:hypothetical protein